MKLDRTILITGASAGIGAACARLAAGYGADIILTYRRDRAGAEAVAADVRAAGRTAQIAACDISDPAQIEALFADIAPDTALDLINNAGIVAAKASVTEMTPERLQQIFSVNVVGAFLVAKHAVTHMRRSGSPGNIVNVSSTAARLGSANQYVDYAASKAAIDTFTQGLADEVAAEGIRVNAVRPGLIETEIHAKGGEPDRLQRLVHMVPLQRAGRPEEVAEAILWLLSDRASYVTRSILDVSAGR
ncbi:Glucose 1-dehydrogenase 2 [Thalassovita gelatinovora]|uniref:Glucose 1-dehydrogenase 2 n=1 Tax=Thalassovita gelatinovora TaxID=53501 RepID=A0A0P1FH83_THAGE|nr:SDR family oxidoreductase [Thalassovita gelatinovora]QIZ79882.1 SDR family oxidoreductase [Thalassovita gelatinovora]CUH66989.1 Glucose 1-dehydrogenase 2 [Thalassovita gelatinovora]SEQ46522.1 glucose 1-dehydrogenase [Thalassovita gelatinovora]